MACAKCPYTQKFTVLWHDATDPDLKAVMLRCCSGPELRILKGTTVLRSEIFQTPDEVRERAEALQGQPYEVLAATA